MGTSHLILGVKVMEKVMYTAIAVFQVFAFVVLCYYLILGLFGTYRKTGTTTSDAGKAG